MRIRKDSPLLEEEEVLVVAKVSDALAHPVRIKLYQHIMGCNKERTPVCTGDLVQAFGYSQATISQHMKKLIQAELIELKKQDRFSFYYANVGVLMQYLAATKKFSTFQA